MTLNNYLAFCDVFKSSSSQLRDSRHAFFKFMYLVK